MGSTARGQCEIFRSVFLIILVSQVIGSATPLPQRGNVQFPPTHQNIFPTPNPAANGIVPVRSTPPPNNNHGAPPPVSMNEFQVGTTGISCDKPGTFVRAPDGCNRCFCAENGQLSSACSRVFCPPGFPSGSQGQYRL